MLVLLALSALQQTAQAAPDQIRIPAGGSISAEGDSLTYGMDASPAGRQTQINGATFPRSQHPYPETLAELLGGCARVVNRGFPGDRSVDGLVRWQAVSGDHLVIMMYGSNDALNYGGAPTGIVSLDMFHAVMRLMIERRQAQGAQVLLLVPPPIGDPQADARIAPYREVVRALGREKDLLVIDPRQALTPGAPVFTPDWVHLSAEANIAIAKAIAAHLRCQ
ncbi:hypothetical protein BTR14_18395 [Rhizobium rhizosphaerae]|uniref:SGNH hydrolase-type esterase domain-containing protein n=1 Tax=Xaviernesmea rhizosphaerae TaxID=1672749 RepID=A0ABX3P8I2_9HYPH|nr:GDSL-type esterase/lipase family protein [Xaviernesmea rhizosphaerae]OQP84603.1 hypothetical protein BTR14_18395 [Xaviernesmea rhizosphaerae]